MRYLLPIAFASLLAVSGPVRAYSIDTHYYLRFALAMSTCFDWHEAHLIASADWGMDENASTHAEMNPVQVRNKIDFHAFGHSDARFRELWIRSRTEPDLDLRLIKLGQFMHFLEDWEAHAGYGIRMGHARDTFRGRDPDSLGNSRASNHRMMQSALDHLLATCDDLGRLDVDRDRDLVRLMLWVFRIELPDVLYEQSNPGWKRGVTGGFRRESRDIKAANRRRIEEVIAEHIAAQPGKNVPDDFTPGDPERGLPPSLQIPFAAGGRVLSKESVSSSWRQWLKAAEYSPDVVVSLERVTIDWVGWRAHLTVVNEGELASKAGRMEVVVVHSDDERLLGQRVREMPSLAPGERVELTVRVHSPTSGEEWPEQDVIVGAFARVRDLSAMNDEDWLMLGDADQESPDVELTTDVDPPVSGQKVVRFTAAPKVFVMENLVCLVVTALVSGGDSTEKLEAAAFEVVGGEHVSLGTWHDLPKRWSAFAADDGLVHGKAFQCYEPEQASYDLLIAQAPGSAQLAITLHAEGVTPHTRLFPIDPAVVQAIGEVLRAREEAPAASLEPASMK
jgi:hypothetical protein